MPKNNTTDPAKCILAPANRVDVNGDDPVTLEKIAFLIEEINHVKKLNRILSCITIVMGVFFVLLACSTSQSLVTKTRMAPYFPRNDYPKKTVESFPSFKGYIDPEVIRYTDVIPPQVCKEIIRLGEELGFPLDNEPVDDTDDDDPKQRKQNGTQQINVMTGDRVNHKAIFELLEPYIPKITKLIRGQSSKTVHHRFFPNDDSIQLPQLDCIFFRKYSPDTPRNSLKVHTDINTHTMNLALNEDYEGGGVFYVRPKLFENTKWDPMHPSFDQGMVERGDVIPKIQPYHWTYEYTDSVMDRNTSDVVFPTLATGDAIIHNFTVWHAVAPIQQGARYSMIFFFSIENPVNQDDEHEEDDGVNSQDEQSDQEDDYDENVLIRNELKHCDPKTGKLRYVEESIHVLWISKTKLDLERKKAQSSLPSSENYSLRDLEDKGLIKIVSENLASHMHEEHLTNIGEIFRAYWSKDIIEGDGDDLDSLNVLATVLIEKGKTHYHLEGNIQTQEDCDVHFSKNESSVHVTNHAEL